MLVNPFTKTCTRCYLHNTSKCNNLKPEGSGTNGVLFVSDYPHEHDEAYNRVLVGPAGTEFDKLLKIAGINRSECRITYLVRCKPFEDKIKKDVTSICSTFLEEEIVQHKPKIIIPLGATATTYFTGKNSKITDLRGIAIHSTKYNCLILPSYNPSVMVKTAKYEKLLIKDFKYIKDLMNGMTPGKKAENANYVYATDIDTVKELVDRVKNVPIFAFDIEATSLTFWKAKLISISFSWKKDTAVCIPLLIKDFEASEKAGKAIGKSYWGDKQDEVMGYVKDILENCNGVNGGHNVAYDILVLRANGIYVNNLGFDTIAMHHLLAEEDEHNLDVLSWIYTNKGGYKDEKDKYLIEDDNYLNIPLEVLMPYNAADSAVTFELYELFLKDIEEQGILPLFKDQVMPFLSVLIDTMYEGVLVDPEHLKKLDIEYTEKIEIFKKKMEEVLLPLLGKPVKVINNVKDAKKGTDTFNINSHKQLADLLFTKLKLPEIKRTKKGALSTDDDVLSELSDKHPIAGMLSDYRSLGKIKSTYIDGLLEVIDPYNRVHTEYKIFGTKTGRLASKNVNLQNIPRDPHIKDIFIASPGNVLLECDMSQHELRVLGGVSNDRTMKEIFDNDRDIHMDVATSFFNLDPKDVDKEKRVIAKKINFGIAYGSGPGTIAKELNKEGVSIDFNQAAQYINKWFKKFDGAARFIDNIKRTFATVKYIRNVFGRRRRFPKIPNEKAIYAALQREAVNFPIQCLHMNTKILTNKGYYTIKELLEKKTWKNYKVFTGDSFADFDIIRDGKKKCQYILTSMKDHVIKCSGDHKFLHYGVDKNFFEKAEKLKKGSLVGVVLDDENVSMDMDKKNEEKSIGFCQKHIMFIKIKDIVKTKTRVEMADLVVHNKSHSFVANGFIVHNSTAADIVARIAIVLHKRLTPMGIRLRLTVHDSLIYEISKDKLNEAIHIIKEATNIFVEGLNGVPFKSDIKFGTSWGNLIELKEGEIVGEKK